ncbi:MAG: tRNA (adenosine(37)-N6)-dimethylallyltransferase MiaA [bacterium]|nr:tRNA (adenosine(37)-N6)-dimethylallyltransferase MiaA [bacterium]
MIIVITGPTAVGKTKLSLILSAKIPNCYIVSVDSRQVYKLMDIGTDKVSKVVRREIPHYLIDIIYPDREFSLFDFLDKSKKIVDFAIRKKKNLIFVGGTILYILSLIEGYSLLPTDPHVRFKYEKMKFGDLKELLVGVDKRFNTNFSQIYKDRRRMIRILEVVEITNTNPVDLWKKKLRFPIDFAFVLTNNRQKIYQDINNRVDRQIKEGLVDEVKFILRKFPDSHNFRSMKTYGYWELMEYINGNNDLETSISLIKRNTKRFAKRQLSFIKKIPADVIDLQDFDNEFNRVSEYICQKLK